MCNVVVEKKNNKNMYLRVRENNTIYITANYLTSKRDIERLINNNTSFILKMLERAEKKDEFESEFRYLGKKYDVIVIPSYDIEIIGNKIYVKSLDYLEKWYKKEIKRVFSERLDYIFNNFHEGISYPKLKIRKMKTRWGVCNRKDYSVTLNSELIKYDIEKLDYVIVHELSHFRHFNHSASFWDLVSKYKPDYKRIRKELRY